VNLTSPTVLDQAYWNFRREFGRVPLIKSNFPNLSAAATALANSGRSLKRSTAHIRHIANISGTPPPNLDPRIRASVFHRRHHWGVCPPYLYSRHSGHTVNLDAQTLFGWPLRRARNGNRRENTSFRRASINAFFQTEREKTFSTAALVIVTSNFSG
jgi:hypothetical protein